MGFGQGVGFSQVVICDLSITPRVVAAVGLAPIETMLVGIPRVVGAVGQTPVETTLVGDVILAEGSYP